MDQISFTLGVSLFDSLTTTLQIIIFVLLLTTEKPLRNALAYLAGLSGAYFACGVVGYLTLDELRPLLAQLFPSDKIPNLVYYEAEFLMGVAMAALGLWYFFRKNKAPRSRVIQWVLSRLRSMNIWFAFGVGLFLSVTDFPISLPYIAALGKYASLQPGFVGALAYILFYNFGYALPMLLLLGVYLFFLKRSEETNDSLHQKAHLLNEHLMTWTLVGFGLLSMADAGCYFALGHALLKGRMF